MQKDLDAESPNRMHEDITKSGYPTKESEDRRGLSNNAIKYSYMVIDTLPVL